VVFFLTLVAEAPGNMRTICLPESRNDPGSCLGGRHNRATAETGGIPLGHLVSGVMFSSHHPGPFLSGLISPGWWTFLPNATQGESMTKRLLEVRQVANRLGIGTSSAYKLIRSGRLPHIKVTAKKGYRVLSSEVDKLLDGQSYLEDLAE